MRDDSQVTFGEYAGVIRANGFGSIAPAKLGLKHLAIDFGYEFGAHPPGRIEFEHLVKRYPACGVSFVLNGKLVVADIDISRDYFPDNPDLADSLVDDIVWLAHEELGPPDWIRTSGEAKAAICYRSHGDVRSSQGKRVEILCDVGSLHVLFYGRHPSGRHYRWIGAANPIDNRSADLPNISAEQVERFQERALALVEKAGLSASNAKRVDMADAPDGAVYELGSDTISGLISDALHEMQKPGADPTKVAAGFFVSAPDGGKHYTMAAVTAALMLWNYEDQAIIDALRSAYVARVHDDRSARRLVKCVRSMRRGMMRRGKVSGYGGEPRRPPSLNDGLSEAQQAAIEMGRAIMRGIFRSDVSPAVKLERAAHAIRLAQDRMVRLAVGRSCAAHLVRGGWPNELALDALELAAGKRQPRAIEWVRRIREGAA